MSLLLGSSVCNSSRFMVRALSVNSKSILRSAKPSIGFEATRSFSKSSVRRLQTKEPDKYLKTYKEYNSGEVFLENLSWVVLVVVFSGILYQKFSLVPDVPKPAPK